MTEVEQPGRLIVALLILSALVATGTHARLHDSSSKAGRSLLAVSPSVSDPRQLRYYILWSVDPDGGSTLSFLGITERNTIGAVLPYWPRSFQGQNGFDWNILSFTQASCVSLAVTNSVSARVTNATWFSPPGDYFNNDTRLVLSDVAEASNTVGFTTSDAPIHVPLNPAFNYTDFIVNPNVAVTSTDEFVSYRPVGAECGPAKDGPLQSPVVLMTQGFSPRNFSTQGIAFTNATCVKWALTVESDGRVDGQSSSGEVALVLLANSTEPDRPQASDRLSVGFFQVQAGGRRVIRNATELDRGAVYSVEASVTSTSSQNNVTLTLRVALLPRAGAKCLTDVPDALLEPGYSSALPMIAPARGTAAASPPLAPSVLPPDIFQAGGPAPAAAAILPVAVAGATESLGPPPTGSKLSTGAIAGIAVGCAAALLAAAVGIAYAAYRQRNRRHSHGSKRRLIANAFVPDPASKDTADAFPKLQPVLPARSDYSPPSKETNTIGMLLADTPDEPCSFLPTPTGASAGVQKLRLPSGGKSEGQMSRKREIELQSLENSWKVGPEDLHFHIENGERRRLGIGGFGIVYQGVWRRETVAIKMVISHTDEQLWHFLREIATLRACTHPHIVQFMGAYVEGRKTLMIMEYMRGGDLYRMLQSANAAEYGWYKRGSKIALEIVRGLIYLHGKGIAHLDLKSPNILLDANGKAKICDVGLGKMCKSHCSTSHGGSILWAAPEQLTEEGVSPACDIFSFGLVLHELCTMKPLMSRKLRELKIPSEAPPEVYDLMLRCRKPPSERPTAEEVYDILYAWQLPPEGQK